MQIKECAENGAGDCLNSVLIEDLIDALKLTQDSARMAAVVTDPRAMMTPGKAVEAFNRYFPEIKRLLDGTGE